MSASDTPSVPGKTSGAGGALGASGAVGTGGSGTGETGGVVSGASSAGMAGIGPDGGRGMGGGEMGGGGVANTRGGDTARGGGGGANSGGMVASGGSGNTGIAGDRGVVIGVGGSAPTGGAGGAPTASGAGGSRVAGLGAFPFPQNRKGKYCILPTDYDNDRVRTAYQQWKDATVTSDGAGGFRRVKKPDSGTVIGSTVSEGIGYGMILAVVMNDQAVFDSLWKYEQTHLDSNGLMNWEIGPDNETTSGGEGAATDGDEDMAFALIMADRQWGGRGTLSDSYLAYAKNLIELILTYEVDRGRGDMLKPGDRWGDVDVTNPSYFAPAYYRLFGQVTGKTDDWNKVITGNYGVLAKSLNASSGNATNGLVPAWCNSSGMPVEAFSGAPKYFQNDATRTPFRLGQDYCWFGEPRARSYLAKISSFYESVGVASIVDGYDLNGTPHPDKAVSGAQAASFVGPAGVAAMIGSEHQTFLDQAYAEVATLSLTAGTIYYQKSWTALSLLMMTGSLVDFSSD